MKLDELQVNDMVLVFDELEQDWYEGRIVHIEDEEIFVEYETEHYYCVGPVKHEHLKELQ